MKASVILIEGQLCPPNPLFFDLLVFSLPHLKQRGCIGHIGHGLQSSGAHPCNGLRLANGVSRGCTIWQHVLNST